MKVDKKINGYHVVADEGKALKCGDDYFFSAYLPKTIDLSTISEIDEKDVPQPDENEDEQVEKDNL